MAMVLLQRRRLQGIWRHSMNSVSSSLVRAMVLMPQFTSRMHNHDSKDQSLQKVFCSDSRRTYNVLFFHRLNTLFPNNGVITIHAEFANCFTNVECLYPRALQIACEFQTSRPVGCDDWEVGAGIPPLPAEASPLVCTAVCWGGG